MSKLIAALGSVAFGSYAGIRALLVGSSVDSRQPDWSAAATKFINSIASAFPGCTFEVTENGFPLITNECGGNDQALLGASAVVGAYEGVMATSMQSGFNIASYLTSLPLWLADAAAGTVIITAVCAAMYYTYRPRNNVDNNELASVAIEPVYAAIANAPAREQMMQEPEQREGYQAPAAFRR